MICMSPAHCCFKASLQRTAVAATALTAYAKQLQ
jgi:hypothetical protein